MFIEPHYFWKFQNGFCYTITLERRKTYYEVVVLASPSSALMVLLSSGFMAGKKITSLMLFESVRNIDNRSIDKKRSV